MGHCGGALDRPSGRENGDQAWEAQPHRIKVSKEARVAGAEAWGPSPHVRVLQDVESKDLVPMPKDLHAIPKGIRVPRQIPHRLPRTPEDPAGAPGSLLRSPHGCLLSATVGLC